MSLESKVQSLITAANAVTGESRTDLTAAVQDLKDGYGKKDLFIAKYGAGYVKLTNGSAVASYTYSVGKALTSNGSALSINLSQQSSWRFGVKFMMTGTVGHQRILAGSSNELYKLPPMEVFNNGRSVGVGFRTSSSLSWSTWIDVTCNLSMNTWYYAVVSWKTDTGGLFVYDESGQLIASLTKSAGVWFNQTSELVWGGAAGSSYYPFDSGKFDLNECFVELSGTTVWGKLNSKTQNMGIIS